VTWTDRPEEVIDAVVSAGSFLDGGGSRPCSARDRPAHPGGHAGRDARDPGEFGKKRQRMLDGLRDLGLVVDLPPEGTFYVWASAQHLPPAISDAMGFFRAALDRKVITVPGEFFDVNPGKRRGNRASRFRRHLRFSFGPPMARLELALARLGEMIGAA
jgi:N-succinyldiaminopimelate aminotransferase